METQKVIFVNKQLNTRLAGLLRLPAGFNLSNNYPAVVVTGPMLSVKEQAQSVYAERLTMAGFVTLVFDGTYFGESEGSEPAVCGYRPYRRTGHLRFGFIHVRGGCQGTAVESRHRYRTGYSGHLHFGDGGFLPSCGRGASRQGGV